MQSMCVPDMDENEWRLAASVNINALLYQIRTAFIQKRKNKSQNERNNSTASRIMIEYINANLFEDLTLEKLSNYMFLSQIHLERVFQKATGSSISKYISIKRLMAARHRIRTSGQATKIYIECGFKDYSAFYRAYKKHFGVSPSEDKLTISPNI